MGWNQMPWKIAKNVFGHETETQGAAALAQLARGKGGIFPPYQRAFHPCFSSSKFFRRCQL